MDKVGVLVKLFLNVIRFFCKNRKGTVKILQGILWRFQKGLAVREAAELAGRGKNPCIDQVGKDGMKIVGKPVMVTDISADVVQPQFGAELLEEQIAGVEETLFVQRDTGKRGKGDSNFFSALVIEQSFFFCFFFSPVHHGSLVSGELCQKIIVFSQFFVDAGRGLTVIFAVGLCNVNILVIFTTSDIDIHKRTSKLILLYHNQHKKVRTNS